MIEKIKKYYWRVSTWQVEAIGVVEVILILVIIISLVLIFKEQITDIIEDAFEAITSDSSSINDGISLE
jgi:ABC-type uncharacterized transport system permease subunit